jgi:hypothetical protein
MAGHVHRPALGLVMTRRGPACWQHPARLLAHRGKASRYDFASWGGGTLLALVIILPWHLWTTPCMGRCSFTVRRHQPHRPTVPSPRRNTGGPLYYVDILRRGFSIWGYLWPLAISEQFGMRQCGVSGGCGSCWCGSRSSCCSRGTNQARLVHQHGLPAVPCY